MTSTLSDNRTGSLEGLEFKPGCCCEAGVCGTHPHHVECGSEAAVIMTVHLVNSCDNATTDANGDEVGPMCAGCHDRLVAATAQWVERLRVIAARLGCYPACATCGAPVVHLSDVIRDVRPL